MTVWAHQPSAPELLKERLARGWQPTPSLLKSGDQVLGFAGALERGEVQGDT